MLPDSDSRYLTEKAPDFSVVAEASMVCVIVPAFPLPSGFTVEKADLLLRLSPGYPDVPPDMWWFDPPVRRSDGAAIPATEVFEVHAGRTWQRWSRHLTPAQWRSGVDSVESYLALIGQQLEQSSRGIAA